MNATIYNSKPGEAVDQNSLMAAVRSNKGEARAGARFRSQGFFEILSFPNLAEGVLTTGGSNESMRNGC